MSIEIHYESQTTGQLTSHPYLMQLQPIWQFKTKAIYHNAFPRYMQQKIKIKEKAHLLQTKIRLESLKLHLVSTLVYDPFITQSRMAEREREVVFIDKPTTLFPCHFPMWDIYKNVLCCSSTLSTGIISHKKIILRNKQ